MRILYINLCGAQHKLITTVLVSQTTSKSPKASQLLSYLLNEFRRGVRAITSSASIGSPLPLIKSFRTAIELALHPPRSRGPVRFDRRLT